MERIKLSRRDFLRAVGILAPAALAACGNKLPTVPPMVTRYVPTNAPADNTNPESILTEPPAWKTQAANFTAEAKRTSIPVTTGTPSPIPSSTETLVPTQTPTKTETSTPTPDVLKFKEPQYGDVYLGDKFKIVLPNDDTWVHVRDGNPFPINDPLIVREVELSDTEQKMMSPYNLFWHPYVGLTFQTNDYKTNGHFHDLLYIHSAYDEITGRKLPGEFLRSEATDHPEDLNEAELTLQQGNSETKFKVIDFNFVTEDDFNNKGFRNYLNDADPEKQATAMFFDFAAFTKEDGVTPLIDVTKPPYNSDANYLTIACCGGPLTTDGITTKRLLVTAVQIS